MKAEIEIVITPRSSDLGDNFFVRRALPYQKKRMVGPFIFLDHMGPVELAVKKEMKVRSHPHIGLSTLTYLFSGEILHRDTLGSEVMIRSGEVNWMTAGNGIAHSETAVDESHVQILEGLQAWIALPVEHEDVGPSFVHKDAHEVPQAKVGKTSWQLVAGSALGISSSVPVYSPLFYLVAEASENDHFNLPMDSKSEGGVYVARGEIKVDEQIYREGDLVVFKRGSAVDFSFIKGSRIAVIGGEIFPEKRFIWWNFVSSSQEKIEAAKRRWTEGGFGQVIHETTQIPLPLN